MQTVFEKFKYTSVIQDVDKTLLKIVKKLESKLTEAFEILNQTKSVLECCNNYENVPLLQSSVNPCNRDELELEKIEILNSTNGIDHGYIEQPLNMRQGIHR